MSTNGRFQGDYTHKDYASLREAMLELASERLPEWTDHSPNDLGVMLVELFAFMGDALFYYQDRIASESYLETATERRSVLHLLRLIGYELKPPVPSSADLTLWFKDGPYTPTDKVTIATDTEFSTTAAATGESITFHYVRPPLDIYLASLSTVTDQDKKTYRVYRTLPVVQVDAAVQGEIVASSDGSGGQRFALARRPLIEGSLSLYVDEGGGPKLWTRVDSLLHSSSSDEHYVVRRDETDTAWIELGDGKYGRAPRRGRNNVTASYRVGGGLKGNVPVNTISKDATGIANFARVFNEKPANGGADREAVRDAIRRGPQQFRSMGRAVSAADYEHHALAFGVAKARAVATRWNRIDIVVVPAGGGLPSDTLREDLRAYFETKRIASSIVEICDPEPKRVLIEAKLEVEPYFLQEQVRQQVEDAVRRLFALENVDFEDTIYLSKIYEAIEAIEGVAGVHITKFAREDAGASDLPITADGRLRFGFRELPVYDGFALLDVQGGPING